jgi:two-component system sensor histidine kinase ChiS
MTVLFSDIRAFTTLSEAMTPRESFEFVNAYLGRVGPVIQRHGGFIDKYIGDAIMALVPERPSDAVGCAVDMMRELRAFNQDRDLRGEGRIAIGIGAHCGELILGTVGEAGRMDTTVISDVVNTASRLEGLTKLYGCGAIVSDEVLGDLDRKSESAVNDPPASRRLDLVRVKGRTAAVLIHELLAGHDESRQKTLLSTKPRFESAGELYRRGEIAEALTLFEEILAIDSLDYASKLFRERCLELLGSGIPPGWDGAYSFDMK